MPRSSCWSDRHRESLRRQPSKLHSSCRFRATRTSWAGTSTWRGCTPACRVRGPVGIRPAGLTGMGGIGKTQLAVEYVYRYRESYPGGIFWVNAADPLAQGLAQIGGRLRPEVRAEPSDRQLQVAFEELNRRRDALLVFDNLEDPAQLARPVGSEGIPVNLAPRVLFTTRHRELGRFHAIEVSVLPEEPALELLLRHESRHTIRDNPNHPERPEAKAICRLLGWLPLALELAGAFLGEWPDISLADYRKRLEDEGCLPTLDTEVPNLAVVNFQPIHDAAVAATLKTQWDALKQADETSRLLLRVAGQFAEAASISTNTLGLFAGVSHTHKPGYPSPLRRALKRLHDVRLVEELLEHRVRLHPLVREFAEALTPKDETSEFRHSCARRIARRLSRTSPLWRKSSGPRVPTGSTMPLQRPWSSPHESDDGVRRTLPLDASGVPTRMPIIFASWSPELSRTLRPASPLPGRDPGGDASGRKSRTPAHRTRSSRTYPPLANPE